MEKQVKKYFGCYILISYSNCAEIHNVRDKLGFRFYFVHKLFFSTSPSLAFRLYYSTNVKKDPRLLPDQLFSMVSRPPPLPIYTLRSNMAVVNCIDHLSPNLLCAGTIEGKVHLWDLLTKRENCNFQAGSESCLNISNVDSQLITQEKGGVIRLWSPRSGSFYDNGSIKSSYVGFCKFDVSSSPSGQEFLIFAPGEDSAVNIFSLKSQTSISSLKCLNERLGEIMVIKCFEMEGSQYLLSAYESGHIFLWDLKVRKCLSDFKVDGTPMDLDFDPVNKMGVCGTESNVFSIFKFDSTCNLFSLYKTKEITNPGVSRVRIRRDGKLLALGCWDGRVRLYSWKTLKPLAVLAEHVKTIHDIYFLSQCSFASCKSLMAVAGKDQVISLWDVYSQ